MAANFAEQITQELLKKKKAHRPFPEPNLLGPNFWNMKLLKKGGTYFTNPKSLGSQILFFGLRIFCKIS